MFKVEENHFSSGCVIKQQKGIITAKKGIFSGSISIRSFKVEEFGNCKISLIQKDKKYFRANGYEYAFLRMIIASQDIDGYRFIAGQYGEQKVLSLECQLNPGQYFVVMMGDWKRSVLDVTLNYQGSVEV